MKLNPSTVRTKFTAIIAVMMAVFVGVLIGGAVAVFLITQLWGRLPVMWIFGG